MTTIFDLLHVAPHLHPDAVVLGSDTMMHTFAPVSAADPACWSQRIIGNR